MIHKLFIADILANLCKILYTGTVNFLKQATLSGINRLPLADRTNPSTSRRSLLLKPLWAAQSVRQAG